jgi:hypothetical protein
MSEKRGRELDKLVAERVTGLKDVQYRMQGWDNDLVHGDKGSFSLYDLVPHYSTDIGAAWAIVDLHSKTFGTMFLQTGAGGAVCSFSRGGTDCPAVFGDFAAHAICLAALEAVK